MEKLRTCHTEARRVCVNMMTVVVVSIEDGRSLRRFGISSKRFLEATWARPEEGSRDINMMP